MAKMNLEELRKSLDTETQQRCLAQEKTIKELIKNNKELVKTIEEKETIIEKMENRCYAFSRGLVCFACGYKDICQARKEGES